jgi:hypothetical protein
VKGRAQLAFGQDLFEKSFIRHVNDNISIEVQESAAGFRWLDRARFGSAFYPQFRPGPGRVF